MLGNIEYLLNQYTILQDTFSKVNSNSLDHYRKLNYIKEKLKVSIDLDFKSCTEKYKTQYEIGFNQRKQEKIENLTTVNAVSLILLCIAVAMVAICIFIAPIIGLFGVCLLATAGIFAVASAVGFGASAVAIQIVREEKVTPEMLLAMPKLVSKLGQDSTLNSSQNLQL